MKKFIYPFLAAALLLTAARTAVAQTYLVNNNCHIVVSAGSQIHVDGAFVNENNGWVNNADTITVTGNWTNNASNVVFSNPATGTVVLDGAAQTINGSGQTWFNNLELTGTGDKTLGVDIRTKGILQLNDKQFDLSTNNLYVDLQTTFAIKFSTGYINTTAGGWLTRAVNNTIAYIFPTGSPTLYRPIDIDPDAAVSDTFSVRLFDHSPTLDGFDVNVKEAGVCEVNDAFYHQIAKGTGGLSQANIIMYFDTLLDGNFDLIAHWQNVPEWQNTSTPSFYYQASPDLSSSTIMGWSSFSPFPFALAKMAPDAGINSVTPICVNNPPFNLTSVTPGGTWSGFGITDPVNGTFNPFVTDTGNFTVYYTLTSGLGCTSIDSTVVTVLGLPGDPITPHGPATICQGTASSVYNSGANNATSFIWTLTPPSAGNIVGTTSTATVFWDPAFAGNVTVSVVASNSCGNSNPASMNVTVYALPDAAFTWSLADTTATFTNTSANGTTYYWDFGDGTNDIATDPVHNYSVNGDYIVMLVATNLCGSDTTYDTIQILTVGLQEHAGFSAVVYPNPFEQSTWLDYSLPAASSVRIALYDITGRLLNVFADLSSQPAGSYRVEISDDLNGGIHGVYMLRMGVNGKESVFKLIRL